MVGLSEAGSPGACSPGKVLKFKVSEMAGSVSIKPVFHLANLFARTSKKRV